MRIVILCIIFAHIPLMWIRADNADRMLNNLVLTCCDDQDYQTLAINLLFGKGYSQSISVPFEAYHLALDTITTRSQKATYERIGVQSAVPGFYRPPGLPILLALTYTLIGNNPLNARRMLAMQAVATAFLLYFTGIALNKRLGSIAGGFAAVYFLNFQPGLIQPLAVSYGALTTEAPTAFWVALFCLPFISYLKSNRTAYLLIAACALAGAVFTRPNLLPAAILLLVYLLITRRRLAHCILFIVINVAPLIGWSLYASKAAGQFVAFTTQSDSLFAETNNMEMLQGSIQNSPGDWSPGYAKDAQGNVYITFANDPVAGQSGWSKGLLFWRDNLTLLPRLFYTKLFAGFWNFYGFSVNGLQPERFHLLGIGFLIAALGLRMPTNERAFFTSKRSMLIVGLLLLLIFVAGNHLNFSATIVIWFTIMICALISPYGDRLKLDLAPTTWFLAFIGCHLITTLVFYGIRFHWPLDTNLMLFSFIGILVVLEQFIHYATQNLPKIAVRKNIF